MGKGLGDNYREGTGRGAVGPGGASPANMPPLCWQQDSNVCHRRLKKGREQKKKKNNLGEFIESCHGRPSDARRRWPLTDLFSCHSWWCHPESGETGRCCGEGIVERGKMRGETESSRGVGFRDYSPWAENQSWWSEVRWFGTVVGGGDGDAGMMSSSTSATQSHHFNFSPHGEIRCVSCVILISATSEHLPVSFYIWCTWTAVSTCPGRYKWTAPAAKLLV